MAQELAENWPAIVAAGASAFSNVDNMVVLNGAEGVTELFTKALSLGGAGFGMARQLMDSMQLAKTAEKAATNGSVDDDFGLSLPKTEI